MPSALAESILSLVIPRERAAAIVGDVLEDVPGAIPFWSTIARIAGGFVWRDIETFRAPMIGSAAMWWIAYCFLSVCYTFIGNLLLYFFDHHTGMELAVDLPWPPPPPSPESWIGPLVWWACIPYQIGVKTGLSWQGREVAAWAVLAVVWSFLAFVTKIDLPAIPLVHMFALAGALDARRRRLAGTPQLTSA